MNICLYGAAMDSIDSRYFDAVGILGEQMAARGHRLIFGGGAHGLMGAAARGMTRGGGSIVGIAPAFFDVGDTLYRACTEFLWPETMRERKQLMENMADAFLVVPGGIGTFDEFFETLTLSSLNQLPKPVCLFNVLGYFDPLQALMSHASEGGFLRPNVSELYGCFDTPETVIDYLEQAVDK